MTKKRTTLIVLLAMFVMSMCLFGITLAMPGFAVQENLVANGNFADKSNGWSVVGATLENDNFVSADKSGAKSGNSLRLSKIENEDVKISRPLNKSLSSGKGYTISFRYRTNHLEKAELGSVYLANESGDKLSGTETKLFATNQVWQLVLFDYLPESTVSATLCINLNGEAAEYYFADFSVTETETIVKNPDFSQNDGVVAQGWSVKWGGKDYAADGLSNDFGAQAIVETKDYADGSDFGKAIMITRNTDAQKLVDIYPSLNTLVAGYSYRVSYKVYSDAVSGEGEIYSVLRKTSTGNASILCTDTGDGVWKEKSFEFSCEYGEENPAVYLRLTYPKNETSKESNVLLLAAFKVERLPKSELVSFTNGNFSNLTNGYPEEWGIIKGTAKADNGTMTVANENGENAMGISFFTSVYEGAQHELQFTLKAAGNDVKQNFKIFITTYSDIERTVLYGSETLIVNMYDLFKTGSKADRFNSYTIPYTAPAGAKCADVSFVASSETNISFSLKNVSFGISEGDANLGFEIKYKDGEDLKPLLWNLTSGKVVLENGKRPNGEGSYVAKITEISSGMRFISSKIPIDSTKINQHYELSYWVKTNITFDAVVSPQVTLYNSEGAASKIVVYGSKANPDNGLKPYTQLNNNVNYSYHYATYGNTITAENPDGWILQRLYFKTASDTSACTVNFNISGGGEYVLLDDVKLVKKDSTSNLDFEYSDEDGNPESWYMTNGRDVNPELKIVDDVYHSGSHSLYANMNALVNNQYITSSALIPVNPIGGINVFEASFWVSSRNSDVKSVQLDVWFHGADGVKIYSRTVELFTPSYKGTIKSLNSGTERSEWSQVITRVPIEEKYNETEIKYISLNFTFTTGKAELWIDDITFNQVESDDEVIVFANDVHAKDSDGNIAEWDAVNSSSQKIDGVLSYTSEDYFCYVTMAAENNAYLRYFSDKTFADYEYTLTVIYKSDYHVNLNLKFYDYKHNEIEGVAIKETLDVKSGEWNTAKVVYNAPSAVFTEYLFDNGGQGELSVAEMVLRQTGKPGSKGDWRGYWISYKTDFRYSDEYSFSYYRGYVDIKEDKKLVSAPLQFTGDDKIALYVNGTLVVDGTQSASDTWASIKVMNLIDHVKPGRNSLAFKVYNAGAYSGMIYDGIWKYEDDERFYVISDKNVVCKNGNDADINNGDAKKNFDDNWFKEDFDDSLWNKAVVQGSVPMDPWGAVYYDSSLYIDNRMDVNVVDGENKFVGDLVYEFTLDIKPEKAITANVPMTMALMLKNSTKTICNLTPKIIENADMTKWNVGEWNRVKFSVELPDYIDSGTYTLKLSETYFIITTENIYDNKFINFRAENKYVPYENETKVEIRNGVPTYIVNGEAKAAYWYIYAPSSPELSLERISESGIETIVNFDFKFGKYESGTDLWQENGTLDFDKVDSTLNTMVAASPDANIVVTLGLWAPDWWHEKNPGQITAHMDANLKVVESNGSQVSFGSTLWRDQCVELIQRTFAHMREQKYYAKIAGVRIAAGGTAENIIFDSQSDEFTPDYSAAALEYFRNWAKETYKTIENLRIVWNDPTIESFETIDFPDYNELRVDAGTNGLYDPKTQQKLIDFRKLAGYMTSDCLNTWAKAIKEATDYKLIVGCYYGYLWAGPSYGVATQEMSSIYGSPYLDFFFAPAGYNERQLGEGEYSEAVSDSARAYGKLFITEQDNRTCLSMAYAGTKWNTTRDFSVGVTHTFNDSILQQKRDAAYNICNGNGQWHYDMLGGWFNDDQLLEMTNDFNDEFNYLNYVERDVINEMALIVPDSNVEYSRWALTQDGDYAKAAGAVRMQYVYKWQRKELDKAGAGYDVYGLSTMVDGLVPEHKIYVFLNPYVLTKPELEAIERNCKQNGKICIFLMEAGYGYNTDDLEEKLAELQSENCKIGYSEQNMKDFTGFDIKVEMLNPRQGEAGQVKLTDSESVITKNSVGSKFGAMTSSISYFRRKLWVEDDGSDSFVKLGVLANDERKIGFAMKKMPTADGNGEWTSIWCAAPYLSQEVYRGILEYAGVHVWTEDNSLILWHNSSYVGAHSASSGNKTIYLDGYYSVYDVFAKKYVSMNTNVIEYYNDVNNTKLYRLSEPNKYTILARVSGGHGSITDAGINKLEGGTSKSFTVTAEEGYVVKSVTINGENVSLNENGEFTIENVNDSYQIVVKFKRTPVEEYVERWAVKEDVVTVPDWVVILVSVVIIGGIVALIVYKNFFKKAVKK